MKVTEALIKKFFADKCDEAEAAFVLTYLKEHPSVLDLYAPKKEWDEVPTAENDKEAKSSKEQLMIIEALIRQNRHGSKITKRASRLKVLRQPVAAVVAAILLIAIAAGYQYYQHRMLPEKTTTGRSLAIQVDGLTDTIIYNETSVQKPVQLPDGSKVTIAGRSLIRYEKAFQAKTRDIYLKGRATFWVTRNNERPFIVHSRTLTTTALGTSFTVTAFDRAATVKVTLHTGKVLVRSERGPLARTADTYLLPGESVAYNVVSGALAVEMPHVHEVKPQTLKTVGDEAGIEEDERQIEFEQVDLAIVLEKLKGIYHTDFTFDPRILKDKSFTGIIKKKLSKETILENIATINNLTITPVEGGYYIRKKRP